TRIMQDTFEVKFEDNTPCASVFYAHELDLAEVQLQCDICGRYFPGVTKNETICSVCDEDFIAALG
ncbi:MAG: hypothetical protein FWE48_07515, partial [Coriobacteriia bacterium]|nr:hypothetical protein [Coriobacteriia bacterium]